MESEYCKICNLYKTCEKTKTCSCENFVTDTKLKEPWFFRKKYI